MYMNSKKEYNQTMFTTITQNDKVYYVTKKYGKVIKCS